jgi:transposase InsO family protein
MEVQVVADHGAHVTTQFLEFKVINCFGLPKYVFIDNGSKWGKKFTKLCATYKIIHQHISQVHPQCNGLIERTIKMLKHGITMITTKDEHVERLGFASFANFVWILLWHVKKHQIFTTHDYH